MSSAVSFFRGTSRNNLSGIPSECQTVLIQIRPDDLSVLIWAQFICNDYQHTALVGKTFNVATHTWLRRSRCVVY